MNIFSNSLHHNCILQIGCFTIVHNPSPIIPRFYLSDTYIHHVQGKSTPFVIHGLSADFLEQLHELKEFREI